MVEDADLLADGPTFGAVLARHARGPTSSGTGVEYGDEGLSWAELYDRSGRRARQLVDLGVRPDEMVAVVMPNGVAFHEAVFAVWRAGATPCVVSSRLPPSELADILALCAPRVVLGRVAPAPAGARVLDPSDPPQSDLGAPPDLAARHWKAVASGGSTGRPKLIVDHAPARFGPALKATVDLLRIPQGGVLINPGPLHHNAALLFTTLALICGTRVVGLPRFDAEETLRLIDCRRGEWVCLVPTMMHRISALPAQTRERYDMSSLQAAWHMAAACPEWLKRRWIDWLGPDRIWELYAGTETPGTSIGGAEWLRKPGSVGRPAPGALEILRADGCRCAPSEVGEIRFPDLVLDRFHYVGSAAIAPGRPGFTLGDLGALDEDGYLFLADRRSDLILRGGANIYPAQIESVLDEHPDVASSLVVGLVSPEYGQRVHALLQPARDLDLAAVDAFVRERLAGYKCPESYELVAESLRDDSGKARRSAVAAQRESWISEGRSFRVHVNGLRPAEPAILST